MKKIVKKLELGRETVRSLQGQLAKVAGGVAPTYNAMCPASNMDTCLMNGCISGR